MSKFNPSKVGFTLVEVAVAMALLLLGLTAFVVAFVQSRRSAAIAEHRLEAVHLARQQMEALCSSNYLALTNGRFSSGVYTGFYTISNNTLAQVKDIYLTVQWVNPGGKITSAVSLAGSISEELHQ
ncbi:MAG: hypothetical protein PHP98_01285 [Kiritimatiellae bacterium]|nr:hypothetical protein [Kiritimatiellia bacterium]